MTNSTNRFPSEGMFYTADYKALGARILAPERPALVAVRELVANLTDPQEAWELLSVRGAIPKSWLTRPGISYLSDPSKCATCKGSGSVPTAQRYVSDPCPACGETGEAGPLVLAPHPPSVGAAVALAADVEHVQAAEELARDLIERLRPWGVAPNTQVVWSVERFRWQAITRSDHDLRPSSHELTPASGRVFPMRRWAGPPALALSSAQVWNVLNESAAIDTVRGRALVAGMVAATADDEVHRNEHRVRCPAAGDADLDFEWRAAAEAGLVFTVGSEQPGYETKLIPAELLGRPFSSVPNPFAPVVAIWGMGYAVDTVRDGVLVLVAPEP